MNAPDTVDLEASQLLEEMDISIDGASFGIDSDPFRKSKRMSK